MLEKNNSKPLYQDIAEKLISDIKSGTILVNEMIPTEKELCNKYSVSRHTVREALRILSEMNLVVRQPGLGTVVKSVEEKGGYVQSIHNLNEILRYSEKTKLIIFNSEELRLDANSAKLIGRKVSEKWAKLSGIRSRTDNNDAICWTSIYLRPELSPVINKIGITSLPVHQLVEKEFDLMIESVKVDIYATSVSEEMASKLNVPINSPGLNVVRTYKTRSKRTVEVSICTHPQDKFTYSIEMHRDWHIP
ncbi:GntR family transcriptional regulator [Alphaproteobacteria bacterium]|nr:GntR family transcriptional regulator [Alphaproteobacteria bacterium]